MGSRSGFDANLDLDELANVIDRGSGAVSAATRATNARANLGITASAAELAALTGATSVNGTAGKAAILGTAGALTVAGTITAPVGTAALTPVKFQTGVLNTVAVGGGVEFDGNAFYATIAGSTKQGMIDVEQYIIQATEPAADNNTGLDTAVAAAVFTANNGAVNLVTGVTYMFEGSYYLTNTGTTSHTWAALFGGTATFTATGTAYQVAGNSSGTANAAATGGLTGFISGATMSTAVVCTAASTSATEQVVVNVAGTLVCAAGGTLIPQMKASARPGASGTPGVVHKAGSFFRIWAVPTLGAVGNWT